MHNSIQFHSHPRQQLKNEYLLKLGRHRTVEKFVKVQDIRKREKGEEEEKERKKDTIST